MQRILLLEDDRNLNRGISLKLEKEGYEVSSAFSVQEAEALFDVVSRILSSATSICRIRAGLISVRIFAERARCI